MFLNNKLSLIFTELQAHTCWICRSCHVSKNNICKYILIQVLSVLHTHTYTHAQAQTHISSVGKILET
jgi:hypothetical protein